MAADIKAIRTRIKSIDSTLHVTKAMQLVASSKIRRAAAAAQGASQYADAMSGAMRGMLSPENARSRYFSPPKTGVACLVVIAGDRGLAGGYNANIIRLLQEEARDRKTLVLPIGNRIVEYCQRHGYSLISSDFRSSETVSDSELRQLSDRLIGLYCQNEFDSLKLLSTKPVNVLSQLPQVQTILPLRAEGKGNPRIVFEPDGMTVLEQVMPDYLTARLCAAVRSSFLAELYARRNSMDSATKNAEDMIDNLSLQYNRARQSSITREITEIVAGAEK